MTKYTADPMEKESSSANTLSYEMGNLDIISSPGLQSFNRLKAKLLFSRITSLVGDQIAAG